MKTSKEEKKEIEEIKLGLHIRRAKNKKIAGNR